jgi:hypothetical protein
LLCVSILKHDSLRLMQNSSIAHTPHAKLKYCAHAFPCLLPLQAHRISFSCCPLYLLLRGRRRLPHPRTWWACPPPWPAVSTLEEAEHYRHQEEAEHNLCP